MTFDEYQKKAISTDAFNGKRGPVISPEFLHMLLGLAGESGELVDKFKKIIRDKEGKLDDQDKAEMVKELGDVLWYVSGLAYQLGAPLHEVAETNIRKLADRRNRGVLRGSGDNR